MGESKKTGQTAIDNAIFLTRFTFCMLFFKFNTPVVKIRELAVRN